MVAHHSNRSDVAGITRGYAGSYQQSVYNLRTAEPFQDRLAPKFREDAPLTLRRNISSQVDAYMDDQTVGQIRSESSRYGVQGLAKTTSPKLDGAERGPRTHHLHLVDKLETRREKALNFL